ncbi:MAG: alcohol dehydrogenase catalytic domain-containing protein [Myxococcota bacterium]
MTPALPEAMRAAVYRERGRIAVEKRPVPEPGPRDVLLRVSHCGVCGTDLHLVLDGWGRPDSIGGHEYSGRIAALGTQVSGWKIGEPAVGGPVPGCGSCDYCRAQRPALCTGTPGLGEFQGAFAEYKLLPETQLVRVPQGLGLREAALSEPLSVALHAVTRSGVRPGQRALVSGAGPIGLLTLAALRARGVEEVVVSEPSEVRRELARLVGASQVVTPDQLEVPRMPFARVDGAVHVAFECSGVAAAIQAALAQLEKTGTLVLVGSGVERPRLDAMRVLLNELVVTGAYNYDEDGYAQALALLASRRLPTDLLIEPDDIALDGLQAAMERLASGRIGGKVLVVPS